MGWIFSSKHIIKISYILVLLVKKLYLNTKMLDSILNIKIN